MKVVVKIGLEWQTGSRIHGDEYNPKLPDKRKFLNLLQIRVQGIL